MIPQEFAINEIHFLSTYFQALTSDKHHGLLVNIAFSASVKLTCQYMLVPITLFCMLTIEVIKGGSNKLILPDNMILNKA